MTDERRPGDEPARMPGDPLPPSSGGYPPPPGGGYPPPPPPPPDYGQQPGYGAPPQGQPWHQAPYGVPQYGGYMGSPPTNGLAVASMVLGIVGIVVVPLIGSILALVFGYQARGQIRDSQGRQSGGGYATAGIIMGWVGIGLGVLAIILVISVFSIVASSPAFREGLESFPTFGP